MRTILGKRLCPHCPGERIELGTIDGESVSIPVTLVDVIGEEREFWLLRCGHRLHKLQQMLSAQEWLAKYPEQRGFLVMQEQHA